MRGGVVLGCSERMTFIWSYLGWDLLIYFNRRGSGHQRGHSGAFRRGAPPGVQRTIPFKIRDAGVLFLVPRGSMGVQSSEMEIRLIVRVLGGIVLGCLGRMTSI